MDTLLAASDLSDSDGDGNYDSTDIKAEVEKFQLNNAIGDSGANFKLGGTAGKAEMKAGTTNGSKGSSFDMNLSATGVSGSIGISAGTEGSGSNAEIGAEGTIGSAEAKASSQIINDAAEYQYGFKTELGAEAAVAKGDIKLSAASKYLKVQGNISGSAGSIGASGGIGVMFDTDDMLVKVELAGKIAAFLGIGGDIKIEIGLFLPFLKKGVVLELFFLAQEEWL